MLKTSNNEMKPEGANIKTTSRTRNEIPERACVLDEPGGRVDIEKGKEGQDAEEYKRKRNQKEPKPSNYDQIRN